MARRMGLISIEKRAIGWQMRDGDANRVGGWRLAAVCKSASELTANRFLHSTRRYSTTNCRRSEPL